MGFRSQFGDAQILFGSGSAINTDDIPESATRQWLTTTSQNIYGAKNFAAHSFSGSNLVVRDTLYVGTDNVSPEYTYVYLGDPAYTASISTALGRLFIEADPDAYEVYIGGDLITFGAGADTVKFNLNGAASATTTIYFNGTTASLKYVGGSTRFEFSKGVYISGTMQSTGLIIPTGTGNPSSPVAGTMYFNTSTNQLRIYNGSAWRTITTT